MSRWRYSLRALLVGISAAAIAVAVMAWLGFTDDSVIIVAAVAAVLIQAVIHRRWWRRRRDRPDDRK